MEHMRTTIAFVAILIQQVSSAAIPITDLEISSVSKPRDNYDTARTSSDSDAAGAAGDSGGSINLKKRDQIAIIVVAALVVIIGVTSAILYYLAKKRQWQVRASIRRSARRIAEPFSPRTPKKMTHGREEGASNIDASRRRTRDPNASSRRTAEPTRRTHTERTTAERQKRVPADKPRERPANKSKANNTRDLEKGEEPLAEKKPSNPESSTVSDSSTSTKEETTATKSKPWMTLSKLPFGRGK